MQPQLREYQLIVTTNYDDALERAFERAWRALHVLAYIATGERVGKPPTPIRRRGDPRQLGPGIKGSTCESATVILKLHGAVDRSDERTQSRTAT